LNLEKSHVLNITIGVLVCLDFALKIKQYVDSIGKTLEYNLFNQILNGFKIYDGLKCEGMAL